MSPIVGDGGKIRTRPEDSVEIRRYRVRLECRIREPARRDIIVTDRSKGAVNKSARCPRLDSRRLQVTQPDVAKRRQDVDAKLSLLSLSGSRLPLFRAPGGVLDT
jgi:hypothetical protein